jgi:hypothetical protein
MWPHLTPWEVLPMIGLRALWLTPDWLLKLLAVAEAIWRYRPSGRTCRACSRREARHEVANVANQA